MRVLGIETSCDETGVAIFDDQQGLMANQLYSQAKTHAQFGGVVPELASRDHVRKIIPLIKAAMAQANTCADEIDALAYTAGPGLAGALLVGASVGQSLAFAWNKPAVAVHHMEGHLLAPLLEMEKPDFPFLALLVSGGHTLLAHVRALGDYEILGQSVDDAAGEAFDKTAKLLGLGYPGGPLLAKCAQQGVEGRFIFPRPMTDRPGLDFSFSGLKTAAASLIAQYEMTPQTKADVAFAFQQAVVDTLRIKCQRALQQTGLQQLVVAGGVGANLALRHTLKHLMQQQHGRVFYPRIEFCTDNGAMIAFAGLQRFKAGVQQTQPVMCVRPRWPMHKLKLSDTESFDA